MKEIGGKKVDDWVCSPVTHVRITTSTRPTLLRSLPIEYCHVPATSCRHRRFTQIVKYPIKHLTRVLKNRLYPVILYPPPAAFGHNPLQFPLKSNQPTNIAFLFLFFFSSANSPCQFTLFPGLKFFLFYSSVNYL